MAPPARFFGTTRVEVDGEGRTPVRSYSDGTLRVMSVNPHQEDNTMAIRFLNWIPRHSNTEAENVFAMPVMKKITTRTFIDSASDRAE